MNQKSTIDPQEINKFAQHQTDWWNPEGPLKTLHDINPIRLEWIERQVKLKEKRVLDVGCGGGILAEAMSQRGALVTGIDADSCGISTAQDHAAAQHVKLEYFCSSIEEFEQQPFDVITCMELLEHVQNPDLILSHCKRLLKPSGFLFLSTINRTLKAYLSAIVAGEYVLKILPKQTHDYQKFIKPSELIALARNLDFEMVEMGGMAYNPFSRSASLTKDVSVNYLLTLRKLA